MADSFTTSLRLLKQTDQGNINIWGKNYNDAVIDLAEAAIAGRADIDVTVSSLSLTIANGQPDTARPMFLRVTGNPGIARVITVPALNKMYIVSNLTSPGFNVEIRTAAFAGYVVEPGETVLLVADPIIGGLIVTPFEQERLYNPAVLPFTTIAFDISNATAGDTVVTASFLRQGHIVYCRLPAISTTISTTDFVLVPQTTVPDILLPDGTADAEFSFCVEDAGTPVDSFLRIIANISTSWVFRDTTLAAYTAAATRTTQHQRIMSWLSAA